MARTKQSDSETRQRLMLAGERLIGEMGIEGVSLRQVNSAAGQKNKSAAHYHFGTKLGLVEAIYDFRMERVNQRREQFLDESSATDVHSLLAAWVYPMVEEMAQSDNGTHYIRFLAKVSTHSDNDVRRLMDSRHASGLKRIAQGLRAQLGDLPSAIFSMRFGLAITQLIHALAEHERLIEVSAETEAIDSTLYVSNLVDVLVAGLQAPISSTSRRELLGSRYRTA